MGAGPAAGCSAPTLGGERGIALWRSDLLAGGERSCEDSIFPFSPIPLNVTPLLFVSGCENLVVLLAAGYDVAVASFPPALTENSFRTFS